MTLLGNLNTLESAGLIRLAQLEPELEYLFRHALVQEAAYASLLEADRRRLHRAVGEAVEALYGDRIEDHAALLARHFERAGDPVRALHYFRVAAQAALDAYANREAEVLYRDALELEGDSAERADLLEGLGAALYGQSRFDAAVTVWEDGINAYRACRDDAGMARLYARSARAAWHSGHPPEGLRIAEAGLAELHAAAESADLARLLHEAGRANHFNGNDAAAAPLCERALAIAERLGAAEVQADTLVTMAILPDQEPETVLVLLSRAVSLADANELYEVGSRAYHNLGVIQKGILNDVVAAQEAFHHAAELARHQGNVRQELFSLVNGCSNLLVMGDAAGARAAMVRIEALSGRIAQRDAVQLEMLVLRGLMAWLDGELAQAEAIGLSLFEQARALGDLQMILSGGDILSGIMLDRYRLGQINDLDRLVTITEEAVALCERAGWYLVGPLTALAVTHARSGQTAAAHVLLDRARREDAATPRPWGHVMLTGAEMALAVAVERFDDALRLAEAVAAERLQQGHRLAWARTLVEWAEVHAQRGEPADNKRAQALLREAAASFADMQMPYFEGLAQDQLAAVRARILEQAMAGGVVTQELAEARRIQQSLLPVAPPELPGWTLAAALRPARQASGDFYDFIPLPDGRLALLVADVADKGAGAALFMAMSRTVLRQTIQQAGGDPAQAVTAANERILADTHSDMFVTLFCAVLDPLSGSLAYCNAGHNPPLLLRGDGHAPPLALGRTGMPIGVMRECGWAAAEVTLGPGDVLVAYTDGLTDALNEARDAYGEARLAAVVGRALAAGGGRGDSAESIQSTLLADVDAFTGAVPPFDDLTVIVLRRLPAVA